MQRLKVYLAKSNLANPDVVQRVRLYLQQFDVEIIEFKGGEYTNGPLLLCDHLIIVPQSVNVHNNTFIIGKGLYNQIKDYEYGKDLTKYYPIVVTDNNKDSFVFSTIENIKVLEKDYINYAKMICNDNDTRYTLESLFKPVVSIFDTIYQKVNKNKYLLLIK